MEDTLFIQLLEKQKEELKEFIKAQNQVTHAKFENQVDRVDAKADKIIAHQEYQNGKLAEHDKAIKGCLEDIESLEREDIKFENYQANCPANKLAVKLTKPKVWLIFGILSIIVYTILATIYHTIGMSEFIERIFRLV